jgi:hypothetical protein
MLHDLIIKVKSRTKVRYSALNSSRSEAGRLAGYWDIGLVKKPNQRRNTCFTQESQTAPVLVLDMNPSKLGSQLRIWK